MTFLIICTRPGGGEYVVTDVQGTDISSARTVLRNQAFLMAASGRHGRYPSGNGFMQAIETGFAGRDDRWRALDGTILHIEKTKPVIQIQE